MTETANILHNATQNSLVLMDEIGRGTSTFDGLSLAWACAEELAKKIQAYTLFATHYFELTSLPDTIPELVNVHLDAVEHGDSIAFLHAVQEGAANKSYGLQVASLAGVPAQVVKNAKQKLRQLELGSPDKMASQKRQLNAPIIEPDINPILTMLEGIDPDELSPKQALALLYQLKEANT